MDDKLIIKRIIRKQESGLEMLIEEYGGFIKAIVKRKGYGDFQDECIDDILMCIWNNIKSYDERKNTFKNWIASITRYKVIDYNRKYLKNIEKYKNDYDLEKIQDKGEVSLRILQKELKEEIQSLLNNLKEKDKKIFVKYYLEEMEVEEIEKEVGLKREAIYNRLSRGRVKLRSILENDSGF
ncbi:MAG: sigma-70 family RNA polymerase sigma factor [Clostridium sp.]